MYIRIRYNFNTIELDESGVRTGNRSLAGATVAILLADHTTTRIPFAGFKERRSVENDLHRPQLVKVLDVTDFYPISGLLTVSTPIPLNMYCVGVFEAGRVYLIYHKDKLLTHALTEPEPRVSGEIVDLTLFRLKNT